jgi:hypothetical protein
MVPSGLHYKHWSGAVVLSYCAFGESYIRWTYFMIRAWFMIRARLQQ